MNLILYSNFSKRKNSTKQPTGGTMHDVKMKAGCSTENPVFLIDGIDLNVTYASWNGAYYFVDEIVLGNNNIYEIHCSIDVLATFKAAIGTYNTYIERAAVQYDEMINDPMLSAVQDIADYSEVRAGRPFPQTATGCFIVEVMNDEGVCLYASDDLEPWKIIFQPGTYSAQNIIDWIDSKIAQAFDLDVYIGTVKWMPFNASSLGTETYSVKIGPITATSSTPIYKVNQKHIYNSAVTLSMPNAYYTDFRLTNPRFSQYYLYLPGCGYIILDSMTTGNLIKNGRAYVINSMIDLVSGEVAYDLTAPDADGNYSTVEIYHGNISVNVPIGKSVSNIAEAAKTTISTVAGTAAGGAYVGGVYGAVAGAAAGLITVADNIMTPRTQVSGGSGNKALLLQQQLYSITAIYFKTKDFATANIGRPVCDYKTIGTLSGFVKCGAASLDCAAHGNEKDMINNYLNGGFYYE